MRRLAWGSIVLAWLVAGCSSVADAPLAPRPCSEIYTAPRCLAMVDEAASQVGRTRDDVTSIVIVPEAPPPKGMLVTRGGAGPINVRLTFTDATTSDTPMCMGVPSGPACSDAPKLMGGSAFALGGGYRDVPCPGEPGGCATPLPTLEASAVAAAKPLSIVRFPIPIDHLGEYEVSLGEASLPNGVGSEASFGFVDDWPADVSLKDGTAHIEIRSLEPDGKPFQNYYDHGWRRGVERVEAVFVFHVLWFDKGAVLAIRDVVVR